MKHNSYILSEFQRDVLRGLFQLKILTAIIVMLILTIGAMCIIRIDQVCKQQIDTLDQLNYIRQAETSGNDAGNRSQVNSVALAPDERSVIERIVMSESGGECIQAQMAVAQTIYDRMNDFGDSLQEAIKTYSRHDNGAPTESVKQAVSNVFDDGMRIYDDGTYQFHDNSVFPYWAANKIKRGSIGRLTFYGGVKS